MKNTLEGVNSRLDEAKGQITDLEDKETEHPQQEQKKEKSILKNEDSLRDIWNNHSGVKLEISYRKKPEKHKTWRLNSMLLNSEWVNNEIKE